MSKEANITCVNKSFPFPPDLDDLPLRNHIGDYPSISVKKGIENTNYLLKTKKNKFILTIFEKRVLDKEIPFFMKLMELLNTHKINCQNQLKIKHV